MIKWHEMRNSFPPEGEFILVSNGDWIGITCMKEDDWDFNGNEKIQVFTKKEKLRAKDDFHYWAPLPFCPNHLPKSACF